MTVTKLSRHCTEDRIDRLVQIATTVGFGEIVLTLPQGTKRECLTDTGIVVILDKHEDFLISAYMVSIDRVTAMYREAGLDHIPPMIYSRVVKNNKKYGKKFWKDLDKYGL